MDPHGKVGWFALPLFQIQKCRAPRQWVLSDGHQERLCWVLLLWLLFPDAAASYSPLPPLPNPTENCGGGLDHHPAAPLGAPSSPPGCAALEQGVCRRCCLSSWACALAACCCCCCWLKEYSWHRSILRNRRWRARNSNELRCSQSLLLWPLHPTESAAASESRMTSLSSLSSSYPIPSSERDPPLFLPRRNLLDQYYKSQQNPLPRQYIPSYLMVFFLPSSSAFVRRDRTLLQWCEDEDDNWARKSIDRKQEETRRSILLFCRSLERANWVLHSWYNSKSQQLVESAGSPEESSKWEERERASERARKRPSSRMLVVVAGRLGSGGRGRESPAGDVAGPRHELGAGRPACPTRTGRIQKVNRKPPPLPPPKL